MQWLGLAPTTLLVAFGATASALVLLHLVRRRRRERVVPFLELFVRDRSEARSLTFLSRRLLWLSLLLLLAIAALVVVAMGDPRFETSRRAAKTVVIGIDISRSMGTRENGTSRLALAQREARAVVRSLDAVDRAMVLAIGAEPEARCALTDDRGALLAAIDGMVAEDVHDDLGRAAEFASDVLAGRPHPTFVVLGDASSRGRADLSRLDRRVELRAKTFGTARENVGIAAFAARRYRRDRSQAEVLVSVRNAGTMPRVYELVLETAGRTIDVRRIDVPEGATRDETVRHLGGAESNFVARIRPVDGKPDALPNDDVAYATLPPRPHVRVLLVSANDLYLEASMWLDESVAPTVIAPSAFTSADGYDLVVFDACLPATPPSVPALYFAPRPRDGRFSPFATRGADVLAPAVTRIERTDPLVRNLDIVDVAIARAPSFVTNSGDQILAASRNLPLIVRGHRNEVPFIAVTFDLRESDLALRMAFPVFVVRAIEELVGRAGELESGFRTDEVARIPVSTSATHVTVVDPRGRRIDAPVVAGHAVLRPRFVGIHRIADADGERRIAAGFGPIDETEIRVGRYERAGRNVRVARFRGTGNRRRPWGFLVLVALALLGFEWWTHHRRWTA